MSPQTITEPRRLAAHPQRPWRPVEPAPRQPARTAGRSYCVAVVRELPPRRESRAAPGTW